MRRTSGLGSRGGASEKIDKPVDGVLAVLRLRAVAACVDDEHAVGSHPAAGDGPQAQLHLGRQRRRGGRVEPKLDGRRYLVDVLPAGTGGADEGQAQFGFVNRDGWRDFDHSWIRVAASERGKWNP